DPIAGSIANGHDNIKDTTGSAKDWIVKATFTLGSINLYPSIGKLRGPPLAYPAVIQQQTDWALDFNGASKGDGSFRGAYAGDGVNPGWQLSANLKPLPPSLRAMRPTNVAAR